LTGVLVAVEQAETLERDRKAWNLPRPPEASSESARSQPMDGLDWEAFSAMYFPGGRRHNLEALVAYAAYKRRP
jgi:hypothetical protein